MLKTLKIPTSDLSIGMYVSALDRPWLETPFITQGFTLTVGAARTPGRPFAAGRRHVLNRPNTARRPDGRHKAPPLRSMTDRVSRWRISFLTVC